MIMKVKKLYAVKIFPMHMVLETEDGILKMFQTTPIRHIQEKDLMPLPYFRPIGKCEEETSEYMYKVYGLTKLPVSE